MTVFLRVLESPVEEKPSLLLQAVAALRKSGPAKRDIFEFEPHTFSVVPGSPFAYWVSEEVRSLFRKFPQFENAGSQRRATKGLATTDDSQFLRLWWEVVPSFIAQRWVTFAKGGGLSAWYSNLPMLVLWEDEGRQLKAYLDHKIGASGQWSRWINSTEYYGREGVTWPLRASRFSPHPLPRGSVFSVRGYAAFASSAELLCILAVFNSSVFDYLFKIALGRFGHPEFVVGVLQRLPWSEEALSNVIPLLHGLARRAWSLKRSLETTNETSHAFLLPPRLNESLTDLDRDAVLKELAGIQQQIDELAYELYNIGPADRTTIMASSKGASIAPCEAENEDPVDSRNEDEDDAPVLAATDTLISWHVGVVFGRFDRRLATGERKIPSEPEPFDPLPSQSPGMWPQLDERKIAPLDIMVDDPGHKADLAALVVEIAMEIGLPEPGDLRRFLACEFFPLHIKMYSKSRRKAPIYWQLATPSASYSVWLYIHAFTKDTLFRVQNDYVVPKLTHEERRFNAMVSEFRDKATAAERKMLAAQEIFVEELRAFIDEVKRVAPLWKPSLDDGVIINFAPLWRLVPQHKSWQKELKATWDALCDEKYDWAHLAMHLWPERVVPKCAIDRSLAIAHDLEDVFWLEDSNGRWTARKLPTRAIDELVRERTSPAVKAALRDLLDAPITGDGARAGRRRSLASSGKRGSR